MDLRISKIVSDFLNGKIENSDFEEWIYSEKSLEDILGNELYIELISLDFKDKSIKNHISNLVESKINYGNLHKQEIIELIDNTLEKQIPLMKIISSFYDWATKGYLFLGRIDVIGNFGEQGKSIVHIIDDSMTEGEKWGKLLEVEPDFLSYIKEIKANLMNGKVVLTGEKENFDFIGTQYKFIEN